MAHQPLIEAHDLSKTYQMGSAAQQAAGGGMTVHALRGVSLSIAEGDFVAIMGSSGSGKSTLMNILGCLDLPSQGIYRLAGEEVETMAQDQLASIRNRRIGFVFQQFNLLPRTSALENVELQRAMAALQRVGLGERFEHTPAELSGGQQQRVAIARALVNQPQLILADEPTGALDTQTSEDIMKLLTELNRQGMTVVLVTHEADIAAWARRKLVFRDGQIIEDVARMELKDWGQKSAGQIPIQDDNISGEKKPDTKLGSAPHASSGAKLGTDPIASFSVQAELVEAGLDKTLRQAQGERGSDLTQGERGGASK
jgi:putative ABC transport system ATP-binding protein